MFAPLVSIMAASMPLEAKIRCPSLRWLVLFSVFIPLASIMDTCTLLEKKILLRFHVDHMTGLPASILLVSGMDAFTRLEARILWGPLNRNMQFLDVAGCSWTSSRRGSEPF